ncbi:GH3 family domain-containing protein [Ruegeria sediminis]|uniref:GH3 family domain-containing protein n=1 Tax=Ruegeria sediminis TaxID=2583820 RepID=UPI0014872322|nr:GH3 auxin-responsive promoter family protein [Ruegeria sediminis]
MPLKLNSQIGLSAQRSELRDFSGAARLYARFRLARLNGLDPIAVQERLLLRLLHRARFTRFGEHYGFSQIPDVSGFQARVPIRRYSDFLNEWWQKGYPDLTDVTWPGRIPFFAMTSGTTTGRSKFVPYTTDMRRAAARGGMDLLCFHLMNRLSSRLFGGLALALTGPSELEPRLEGVNAGAVSAIALGALPVAFRNRLLPPPEVANLPDWQEKIERLVDLSVDRDVRILGGSPNWLLIFLEALARRFPDRSARLSSWFPNLELIMHGGVNFEPYRDRFRKLLVGSHAETREMYSASEGVFAIADRGDNEGMRLHLDGGVFFEFVPVDTLPSETPVRHWVANAETGQDYALVVSTSAGLWAYLVGDVVRLVDRQPPRLIVVGRVENGLSVFGEHLIEAEIAQAIAKATASFGLSVLDYCVGAITAETGGHHLYLLETIERPSAEVRTKISERIDAHLCALNEDYSELRRRNLALDAPEVRFAQPGGFVRWMELRRKLGGQNKVPRIITDEPLFKDILATVPVADDGEAGP